MFVKFTTGCKGSLQYSPPSAWPLVQLAVSRSRDAYKHRTCARRFNISEAEQLSPVFRRIVVIAVAGSQRYTDWKTNFNNTSSPPKDILV
jgi:hypothetical protein